SDYSTCSSSMDRITASPMFFFNNPTPIEFYILSLHDALPISAGAGGGPAGPRPGLLDPGGASLRCDRVIPERLKPILDDVRPLAERFEAAGHAVYLVGGIVRDLVLGRATHGADLDLTTDARPGETRAVLQGWADAVWDQGAAFGTIGARKGGTVFEITTHRAEAYREDSRKPHVVYSDDVTDDLSRRDFTVNAMALRVPDLELIDPYGGVDDLAAGVLRTPLAPEVSFSDDPLRMLRAARFIAGYGLR